MTQNVKLYHGDCLEVMKKIPDKSIDMILCDLPYGTTACKWDVVIPFEPLWQQYNRIIKVGGAVVLFGSEPFSSVLRMSNIKNYKYDWIWDKVKPSTGLHANIMPLKDCENISVFNAKIYYPVMTEAKSRIDKPRIANNGEAFGGKEILRQHTNNGVAFPRTIIKGFSNANQRNRLHPTQKPVALLEYLIKTYTLENETVLDNTMGSGSTGVACVISGRDFIGIEKDETYFNIAKKRIKNAQKGMESLNEIHKRRSF